MKLMFYKQQHQAERAVEGIGRVENRVDDFAHVQT
jgi:hypothetical protein